MLFNSFTFIVFFAVVLGLHNLPLPWKVKKFNLLWASYLFYAAWNPPFVILLWVSTVADWFIARRLDRTEVPAGRRLLLLASLSVNLGLLGFFKYSGFLMDNFVSIVNAFGLKYQPALPSIILPVGISFYTFQTLSYTLDIYFRKSRPWHSFLDYAMYVTFFPQLVAGPIVRAADFLPQCVEPRRASASQLGWGLTLLTLGLFEKIAIADGIFAPVSQMLYDAEGIPSFASAWSGTLAFAGQIFCDFAGYSTCAIGAAMALGFILPSNFHFPYGAIGFSDFWRRWHISLSTWLRDYLYIPLGGNRKGSVRTCINVFITMLLGGLWHGASWTFVIWGGLHGVYLLGERLLSQWLGRFSIWRRGPVRICLCLATFVLVCFAWVFFRARTFSQAFTIVTAMVGLGTVESSSLIDVQNQSITLVAIAALLSVHWFMRDRKLGALFHAIPWWLRSFAIAGMLFAIVCLAGDESAFIYFQF